MAMADPSMVRTTAARAVGWALAALVLAAWAAPACYASEADDEAAPAITAVAAPTATTAGAPTAARVLRCTYEQCVARAMLRSPLVHAASLSLDSYEAKAREARSAKYPRFTLSVFASILPTVRDDADGNNPFTDYDFSPDKIGPLLVGEVSVTQPIYTFGKIAILRRLAAQGVEIGRATRRIAEAEMRYQVARAWYGLVLVRDMADMIKEGRRLLGEQRDKLERQRDEGDERFNQGDLLKLQMSTADFEDKVRMTERSREQALDGLRLAMDETTDLGIEPTAEALEALLFPLLPSQAYEAAALANHPRLVAMRHGTLARLQQVELARAQLWPDIAGGARLAGTYAPTRDTSPPSLAANPNNIAQSGGGIVINWNLDVFRNLAKLDQAKVDAAVQTAQERGEREKMRMEVRQLYRELADARAMLPVHEQAMKAARGWLNSENEMYESGFQDFAEVLKAIESYYRRRLAWLESIYTHNLAVAALSRAVGIDVSRVGTVPMNAPRLAPVAAPQTASPGPTAE